MNKDKLFMVSLSSVVGGLFGGLVCVIKDSLFEKDIKKSTDLKESAKSFGRGFLVGSILNGTQEALFYNNREEFKNRVIESEVQRRINGRKI